MTFTRLLATAALIGLAAANPTLADDAPVTLTWQMWGTDSNKPVLQEMADLVHKEYPNITVNVQISGWTDYWTKLPIQASSGQLADIVSMTSSRVPNFYTILEPLDAHFATDGFDTSVFEPSILAALSFDKTVYSLPYDVGPWLIYYNKDKFAKAGVPEPKPGWTMADLRATAKALTGDGSYGYSIQLADFITLPRALGAEYVTDDGQFDLLNAANVKAVTELVDMASKDHSTTPISAGGGGQEGRGAFTSGGGAMFSDGPWSLIDLSKEVTFKLGVTSLPRGEGPLRAITAGSGFGVSAASPNKEAAYKALQVLTGAKVAEILGRTGRALPARIAQQHFWIEVAAKDVAGAREALEYSFANTIQYKVTSNWTEFENQFSQNIPLAANGDVTPEEMLRTVQELVQQ